MSGSAQEIWPLVVEDVSRELSDMATADAMIADMRERDKAGRARFGKPLCAHNGRNAFKDAYQQALCLVAYLRQAVEEKEHGLERAWAHKQYLAALRVAYALKTKLLEEK